MRTMPTATFARETAGSASAATSSEDTTVTAVAVALADTVLIGKPSTTTGTGTATATVIENAIENATAAKNAEGGTASAKGPPAASTDWLDGPPRPAITS
jgi:hypothetical protein